MKEITKITVFNSLSTHSQSVNNGLGSALVGYGKSKLNDWKRSRTIRKNQQKQAQDNPLSFIDQQLKDYLSVVGNGGYGPKTREDQENEDEIRSEVMKMLEARCNDYNVHNNKTDILYGIETRVQNYGFEESQPEIM